MTTVSCTRQTAHSRNHHRQRVSRHIKESRQFIKILGSAVFLSIYLPIIVSVIQTSSNRVLRQQVFPCSRQILQIGENYCHGWCGHSSFLFFFFYFYLKKLIFKGIKICLVLLISSSDVQSKVLTRGSSSPNSSVLHLSQ